MKKTHIALASLAALLVACSPSSETTATPDDGTVNGRMVEDAGGDGTNTTGGGHEASSVPTQLPNSSYSSAFPQ